MTTHLHDSHVHTPPTDETIGLVARDLERAGIWTSRTAWTTRDGVEVADDDPDAAHQESVLEIDYARIVRMVLNHPALATGATTPDTATSTDAVGESL